MKAFKEENWQRMRAEMVEMQLRRRGIRNERVLDAFNAIPRHKFVSPEDQGYAYEDHPISIGCGQTISQPYMVAVMVELLSLTGTEKVLEIGTGSGYQTAILSKLVSEVYSIECHKDLVREAQAKLKQLGCRNIYIRTGDGGFGWDEASPFDACIISAATPVLPPPLKEQVRMDGVIVYPKGSGYSQTLIRTCKRSSQWKDEELFACVFVPLVGKYGQ